MPEIRYSKMRDLTPIPVTKTGFANLPSQNRTRVNPSGKQFTASEGHPWHMKPRPRGDIGGEFQTIKSEFLKYTSISTTPDPAWQNWVNGPVFPSTHVALFTANNLIGTNSASLNSKTGLIGSSDAFLNAQGTIAIDRVSPVNSIANVATTIGELKRDGLPSIPLLHSYKDKTQIARDSGNEYLNYQFGWAPLISDIQNFAKAVSQSGKILAQLERDSGKVVRRRYEFPIEKETVTLEKDKPEKDNTGMTYFGYTDRNDLGKVDLILEKQTRRWFSGAFTYYIPSGDSLISRVVRGYQEADKLLGFSPDPETLWNISPWSWAADWAFNTGSVISNLSDKAQYGLVMPYGYIMEETSFKYTSRLSGLSYYGPGRKPIETVFRVTRKTRLKASPFGFGLSWDGFDTYQTAIIAALGLTRQARL